MTNSTFTSTEIEGMDFDSFTAEYGTMPTLEELRAKYPQYAPDYDHDAFLDEQNEEAVGRSIAQGYRY